MDDIGNSQWPESELKYLANRCNKLERAKRRWKAVALVGIVVLLLVDGCMYLVMQEEHVRAYQMRIDAEKEFQQAEQARQAAEQARQQAEAAKQKERSR
jgi:hypothetical protein